MQITGFFPRAFINPNAVHLDRANPALMTTRFTRFEHAFQLTTPTLDRRLSHFGSNLLLNQIQETLGVPSRRESLETKLGRASFTDEVFAGLSGTSLLEEVDRMARRGFNVRSYREAQTAIFSTIDNVMIDGVRGVYSSYSEVFVPGEHGHGSHYKERGDQNGDGRIDHDGMNIEHLWPQSYFNRRSPMRADVHHLLPTFMYPNNQRGRLPFGEVEDEDVRYETSAGARSSESLFEPQDLAKGQVARAMFYFYTRYRKHGILPKVYRDEFWNRTLPTLMRWNREYPPDDWERERNNRIEKFQGNRNPFVDHHELVDRIGLETFQMK